MWWLVVFFFFSFSWIHLHFDSPFCSVGKHSQMDQVQNWEFIDLVPVRKWASTRAVMFVESLNHFAPQPWLLWKAVSQYSAEDEHRVQSDYFIVFNWCSWNKIGSFLIKLYCASLILAMLEVGFSITWRPVICLEVGHKTFENGFNSEMNSGKTVPHIGKPSLIHSYFFSILTVTSWKEVLLNGQIQICF